jgi:hypothetical protein
MKERIKPLLKQTRVVNYGDEFELLVEVKPTKYKALEDMIVGLSWKEGEGWWIDDPNEGGSSKSPINSECSALEKLLKNDKLLEKNWPQIEKLLLQANDKMMLES